MKKTLLLFIIGFLYGTPEIGLPQSIINQTIVTSSNSKDESNSDDDIGGVEFRRIPVEPNSKIYYFEFENYHSFPVTVHWQATISSDRFSHWYTYGDSKNGTIVLRPNQTKRTTEKYSYGYDLDFIRVRRL